MTSVLHCVPHSEGSFENHILIKGQANLQLVVKDVNMDIPKLIAVTNSYKFGGTASVTVISISGSN